MLQSLAASDLGGLATLPAAAQNALILATEQVNDARFKNGQLRGLNRDVKLNHWTVDVAGIRTLVLIWVDKCGAQFRSLFWLLKRDCEMTATADPEIILGAPLRFISYSRESPSRGSLLGDGTGSDCTGGESEQSQ